MKPTTVSTANSHNHISHPSLPSPITPPSDAPPLVPPQLPHPTGSRHLTPDPAPAVRVRGAAWPMCTGELPASATVVPPHTATRCRAGRPLLPRGSRVMGMLVVLKSGRGGGVYLCDGGGFSWVMGRVGCLAGCPYSVHVGSPTAMHRSDGWFSACII